MNSQIETQARTYWEKTWNRFLKYHGMIAPSAKLVQHLFNHVPRHGVILDLGCGDGILLTDTVIADIAAHGGRYLGVDASPALIEAARSRGIDGSASFLCADIADPGFTTILGTYGVTWGCVISVFVVQEMPDIDAFAHAVAAGMSPDSAAAVVTVHPRFAEALHDHGVMHEETTLAPDGSDEPLWRWAGYYPIVDEPRPSFMLPYFHRTVEDYVIHFAGQGLRVERVIDLPDPAEALPRLISEGVSPFTPFPGNDYWPYIADMPSALGFILRRGTTHG